MPAIDDSSGITESKTPAPMDIRGRRFDWGSRTYVMAIINATWDSFSGDGVGDDQDKIRELATEAQRSGADFIDVGGESTRPGAAPVSAADEINLIIPAIHTVRAASDLPISVDTYKAEVAREALDAGADIVNDVWGLRRDPAMASLVAEAGCALIVMHNRRAGATKGSIGGHYREVAYDDLVQDIVEDLEAGLALAVDAGIDTGKVVIDPGFGFGKSPAQNVELLSQLSQLRSLGLPILVGVSRKSFIGYAMGDGDADRTAGAAAATALAIGAGADIIRVHDVRPMVQVARVADAIVRESFTPRS